MEVFNKFYSSVSSTVHTTVSNINQILPGNPITREYEIQNLTGNFGIGGIWKVHNGYKKSTKESVSIFILEKNKLEKYNKTDREIILNNIRKGITQQTKIRHPNFLTIQHQMEESRDSLCFATEPVWSNLRDLISNNNSKNEPTKLYDMEIKHGLINLCEGLIFLHNDMKILHRNLIPENIIINVQRQWKIFGLEFCLLGTQNSDGSTIWQLPDLHYNNIKDSLFQPQLEWFPPEISLNSSIYEESDMYLLGILIYSIYSNGKTLKSFANNYKTYEQFCTDLNKGIYPSFDYIPAIFFNDYKRLLHPSPQQRMKLEEFCKIQFFNDVGVQTLVYFDSLYQWDNLQKSKFYKGLNDLILSFSHEINIHSIIPNLVKEFINPQMVPFVLPNVFLIMKKSQSNEYVKYIMPYLNPVMKIQEPIQIPYILMQNIDLLLKLTPESEVKSNLLPMLYRLLECNNLQLQEMCLNIIPDISKSIDYNSMKNNLIPKIENLCTKSESSISTTVKCLVCIGKLLDKLDKWLINDDILPFLCKIRNRDPAVLMAIIGIYKIAFQNPKLGITKDVIALKIIPFMMPMCIEDKLNITQFNVVLNLLKEMINKVENEQRIKIQQLSNSQINLNSNSLSSINDLQNDIVLDTTIPFNNCTITPTTLITSNKTETINPIKKSLSEDPFKSVKTETSQIMTNYNFPKAASGYNLTTTKASTYFLQEMDQPFTDNKTSNKSQSSMNSMILKPELKKIDSQNNNSNSIQLSQQDILDFLK